MNHVWVPDNMYMKFTYEQPLGDYTLIDAGGTQYCYVMSGNSIFDPDATVAGKVALMNTLWGQFYTEYEVLASKCQFTVVPDAQSNTYRLLLIPTLNTNGTITGASGVSDLESSAFVKKRLVFTGDAGRPVTIKNYMNTRKMYGSKFQQGDPDLIGIMGTTGVGSNPTSRWYWALWASSYFSSAAATGLVQIPLRVKMTYYVRLTSKNTARTYGV